MRLGLVVTKKIGCAVIRNKVKRLLRECFRQLPICLRAKPYDIVVIARYNSKTASYVEIGRQLQSGVSRALSGKKGA